MRNDDSDIEWRTKSGLNVDDNFNVSLLPPEPDIGLLDICVARVTDVTRHPVHYYTMYLVTMDTGRYQRKRKAASTLVDYYKPSDLIGRLVLTVLNVRPMLHRELVKRFLLLCAQNPKDSRLELLQPPAGSVEGDSVVVDEYRNKPLREFRLGEYMRKSIKHYFLPYKKHKETYHYEDYDETKYQFDSIAEHLWVNQDKVATFMGSPLQIDGKAPRRAAEPFKGDLKVGGRLDLKVGLVVHVEDHVWDDNRFFFEYIEAGDRVSNCFVRGINKFFKKEDFENMRVVLLYIALPHWWNCQESRLLSVLSARTRHKVEMLEPPDTAEIGEDIVVDGMINVKPRKRPRLPFYEHSRKLMRIVAPDLRVNDDGVANYAGRPMYIPGKGNITAKTLRDCPVK